MDERIRTIIAAGIKAPSGDNCQPWRFEVNENRIDLFNIPERDTSLYNYKQRASLVAHGACIENMLIAARTLGFSADLQQFPTPGDEQHVGSITLQSAESVADPLYSCISERTINRRMYAGGSLPADAVKHLNNAARGGSGAQLILFQERDKIAAAADIVALSDRLVFENKYLHGFLFDHIRWTAAEAEQTQDGLDLRTLELAPPDRLLFPLLKSFGFVSFLATFGVTKIIAANARKLMLSASAAGLITIENTSAEAWLNAGRLLERIWLEATRQGLAFHLMTGVTLMVQRVQDGELKGLGSDNISLVKQADTLLAEVLGPELTAGLLFRIGDAPPPRVLSLRRGWDKE